MTLPSCSGPEHRLHKLKQDRAVDVLADVRTCAFTGKSDRDAIKIMHGGTIDIWPGVDRGRR